MSSARGGRARAVGALAATGVAGVAYAGLVERNLFTLRRAAVAVLPPGSPPLRVLQVSDLHLVPRQRRKIDWVRSLADLRPDFVVNSGDNLAAMDAVPALLRAMEPLLEYPGRVRPRLERLLRAGASATRPATSRRTTPSRRRSAATLPVGALVSGLVGGWLGRPRQRTRRP